MGEVVQTGMSKREYFAAKAMQGILRAEDGYDGEPTLNGRACMEYARQAVDLADALISALKGE